MFLGANLDSQTVAHDMGMRRGTVVDWAADDASHARSMSEANLSTTDYRRTKRQQVKYRDRRQH